MKYLAKTIEYGLYLLIFLLPLQTRWIIKAGQLNSGPWEYGTYGLYGTDILLIVLLALFVIYRIFDVPNDQFPISNNQINSKFKIQNYFIWGLVLASAVSAFFAADKPLALYKFGWLILGVGLFWLVRSANYDKAKLIYAMLTGAFLQAGLGTWQFLTQSSFASKWLGLALHNGADLGTSVIEATGADGVGERWLRAYGGMDHPNILGGVLAVGILFLLGEIIGLEKFGKFPISNFQFPNKFQITNSKPQKIKRIICWLLLVLFTAGLFFSFSRSAWLALGAGLIVMIILAIVSVNLKSQKGLAKTILAMGILLFLLSSQYENLITARLGGEGRLEIKSTAERLASYQEAWGLIKNHWLFGVGSGNYTLALSHKLPERESYDYQPAHNVFLMVWAETGIVSLLFFIGLIMYLTIFNFQFLIFKQFSMNKFSKPSLKIVNWKLEIWENGCTKNPMFSISILIALIVLMSFDHWLFSLHFGVLFFWLAIGLVTRSSQLTTHSS